jgi:Flp pilus assembly protein TadD
VDLLLAARQRGFSASLVSGSEARVRAEIARGRPVILMLKLLNAPGRSRDIYHYVVVDGVDPGRDLLRFQFGDGKVRWTTLEPLEGAWKGAGYALLSVREPGVRPDLSQAIALERAGRLDEAAAQYRLILEGHPDSVRGWVNLGNVRSQQGQEAAAERAYREALTVAPGDPDALNNLAWLLLQRGSDLEEAERLALAAATSPGPDRAQVLDTLAHIQGARGRCEEADATFEEALELADLGPTLRAELDRGRTELARTCWRDR